MGPRTAYTPRFNSKYTLWSNQEDYRLNSISVYGGWGKSVKLPSFEVLYPSPSYADKLAFAPGTMNDGTTFYAYYSIPSKAVYNPDLKWQYANQTELGIEANIKGTKVNISTYRNITYNPYMLTNVYTPYTYKQTSQSHLESCIIPSSNREYSIDKETGIVTVADKTGVLPNQQLGYKERDTFKSNRKYVNGSPVERMGLEWIVDFAKLNPLNTTIRLDGRYYYYKSLDETLIASMPSSASTMADGNPYKYVGYYIGASGGSTSYVSSTSVANGSISKELNTNLILTSHIPKIRMILSVRLESSLYNYRQSLCEYSDGGYRGMALENGGDYSGVYGDVYGKDKYVAVYPKYYSTWDDPDVKIPFAEKLSWAKENDAVLYNELTKLVMKTNTSYYFNPNRISSYFSANFSLTKEIGDYASVSFFANNFFNHVGIVKSSQAGLETSLYASAYIPKFYYGLTLKLKI
jgi:TonB dependent receptor.